MKKFSGLGYELILVLAALSTSLLTGCGPAVAQPRETSNTKTIAPSIQSAPETQAINAEPKSSTNNRVPIQKSPTSFTYRLSSGNHSGPGKDLKERAYLLMQAFTPGLDDSLDAQNRGGFIQELGAKGTKVPRKKTGRFVL